jgi:hypothetical protein
VRGSTAGTLVRHFKLNIVGQSGSKVTCQCIVGSGYGFNSSANISGDLSLSFGANDHKGVGAGALAVDFALNAGMDLTITFVETLTAVLAGHWMYNSHGTFYSIFAYQSGGKLVLEFYDLNGTGLNIATGLGATGHAFQIDLALVFGGAN